MPRERSLTFLIFSFCLPSLMISQETLRMVGGNWSNMEIDTITPLNELVKRLELPWEFLETGKHYWIGYTKDMFSIARYKDKAILPLTNLIDNSDCLRARVGALYTLHLIGIDSHIVGRFKESFIDTLARNSIIVYLNDIQLHETVLKLLMRDPWSADIPHLMKYLSNPTKEYIGLLSALQRYSPENNPFGQKLPDEISNKTIEVRTNGNYEDFLFLSLISLQSYLGNKVYIDDEILNTKEWKKMLRTIKSDTFQIQNLKVGTIIDFLTNSEFSYSSFVNRFFYIFEQGLIKIYGPIKARKIWLDWWEKSQKSI